MSEIAWMTFVWLSFVLAVAALCLLRPNAGRLFVGVFFLIMAVGVNLTLVVVYPRQFVALGENSFLPLYRWLFTQVISLAPAFFGLVAVAYELTLGTLLLGKGRAVRVGLVMGVIFLIGTTPFMLWTLPNFLFALVLAWLFTKDFDASLLDVIRSRRYPRRAHTRI